MQVLFYDLKFFLLFKKRFYLFLERGEGREKGRESEREKNINVQEKHR